MFITRAALPRRTVLRGLGASLALPLLDAMVPAATVLARRRTATGHCSIIRCSSTAPG